MTNPSSRLELSPRPALSRAVRPLVQGFVLVARVAVLHPVHGSGPPF